MKSSVYLEKITEKITTATPGSDRGLAAVYQYNIEADDGIHAFIMDLKNLKTGETTTETVDVTINLSDDVFVLLHSKKLTYKERIAQGKVTITGNMELADKLFALQ